MAGGHFGNFELATRVSAYLPGYRGVATYRGISFPRVNGLIYQLRTVSGNILVDRRSGVAPVTRALAEGGKILTLAADQHNRSSGMEVSLLGHPAWTTRAPVVLARRYNCELYAPVCYRVGLARWRIELGLPIPLDDENGPRPTADVLQDMNNVFGAAVIRDPANWFWFHRRWRAKSPQA
jgi:Kdo2-lipid IVA lauroyltransferase/acyltransferase